MQYLGHSYTKKIFFVYFIWHLYIRLPCGVQKGMGLSGSVSFLKVSRKHLFQNLPEDPCKLEMGGASSLINVPRVASARRSSPELFAAF